MTTTLPPAYHRNDPETSEEAATLITESGKRQKHIDLVVSAVARYPGCGSAQLAAIIGMDRHEVARRLPDALKQGRVHQGDRVVYEGRKHVSWWPVYVQGNLL